MNDLIALLFELVHAGLVMGCVILVLLMVGAVLLFVLLHDYWSRIE